MCGDTLSKQSRLPPCLPASLLGGRFTAGDPVCLVLRSTYTPLSVTMVSTLRLEGRFSKHSHPRVEWLEFACGQRSDKVKQGQFDCVKVKINSRNSAQPWQTSVAAGWKTCVSIFFRISSRRCADSKPWNSPQAVWFCSDSALVQGSGTLTMFDYY